MKDTYRAAVGWGMGVAVGVAVLLSGVWSPAQGQVPGATYITGAKCKMCHAKPYQRWSLTEHAQVKFPWETGAAPKPETPSAGDVYRFVTGYDPAANTWAEKGVSCEACHGPGSAHMTAKSAERKTTIVDPATFTDPARQESICGRCHGSYTTGGSACALAFRPGDNLFEAPGFTLTPPAAAGKMAQLNELRQSKHFAQGVTCLKCHSAHPETALPHQLRKPVVELCLECHQDKAMATHAPNAAAGATCATCHMPDGRHSFTKPAP